MWEDCQAQKKKNSRAYQRTLTYLFLQKIRCPKCNNLMGGKATKKKNGNVYYYYYCNDCKLNLKENVIEEYFANFINEIVEYDSVIYMREPISIEIGVKPVKKELLDIKE